MAVIGELSDKQSYVRFFQQRIVRMITHWRDHDAMQQLEVTVLDREREGILKAITLGLEFGPAWPLVRSLITSFTPYMERRGHWETWQRVLLSAIGVAQRLADPATETTLTGLLARLSQRMGHTEDVIYYYRQTIRLARQSGNR
ncbi:MAG: hypothetical protein KDE19_11995, partial [Caldilineaceae bacterium]|nr:hypothetical protein [Caldilineaceae bacterium]